MSNSDLILFSTSTEFMKLCETQILLLSQNLGAVESAVYLTEITEENETKLVPVYFHPHGKNKANENGCFPLLPAVFEDVDLSSKEFLPIKSSILDIQKKGCGVEDNDENKEDFTKPKYQLVLPLVYQEVVLGLLITRKKEKEWTQTEFSQVERIADTIALARVLDEQKLINQEKFQQQKALNQLTSDRLDDFIHQIRNPLTALRTFAKLLLKKISPQDNNYQFIQNILREGDRLKSLIEYFNNDQKKLQENFQKTFQEDLNYYSLNESSSSFLLTSEVEDLEALNIREIIEPILAGTKAIALEKNVGFETRICQNLPLILANEKALIEVLNNILDNAVKYTPSKGKVYVEIGKEKTTDNKKRLGVKISDTGYGIPAEDIDHIFERNYRGNQEKSDIFGTGLGLAIVKDLCDKMNIEIELFSPSGISENDSLPGTTFIIWLLESSTEKNE